MKEEFYTLMNTLKYRVNFLIVLTIILSMVVVACGGGAAPAADQPAAEEEPAAAEPAAEEEPASEEEADEPEMAADDDRRETVIFDIDGGRVVDPELWNPYIPGRRLDHGAHQAMMEPLFILNYQTGIIEPWLGEKMESNDAFDVWTLKLREGIKWSDGEVLDADDVVFTMNMLLDNAPELQWSAGLATWLASVEKIDDLTIQFNLSKPNPRFQLDNFSVRIWGGPSILPEHIWNGQDPLTFKNYDPAQGWPVFTGPLHAGQHQRDRGLSISWMKTGGVSRLDSWICPSLRN